jgi:hypothetical protein
MRYVVNDSEGALGESLVGRAGVWDGRYGVGELER